MPKKAAAVSEDDQWTVEHFPINGVRERLGDLWGLGRALSRAELARALFLSPKYGHSHIFKLEKAAENPAAGATLTGPIAVACQAMLDGWVPKNMASIVKPGYPRRGSAEA